MFGSTCAIHRGFFILRACDQTATGMCAACGRPMCLLHSGLPANPHLCVECAARQTTSDTGTYTDNDWAYRQRHQYYTDDRYRPIDTTGRAEPYYSEYDVRAFDSEAAGVDDDADDGGTSIAGYEEPAGLDDAGLDDPGLIDS